MGWFKIPQEKGRWCHVPLTYIQSTKMTKAWKRAEPFAEKKTLGRGKLLKTYSDGWLKGTV